MTEGSGFQVGRIVADMGGWPNAFSIIEKRLGSAPFLLEGSAVMNMNFFMASPPLISLLAGISILLWPRLLSYIVAFYLILFGLVGLLPVVL